MDWSATSLASDVAGVEGIEPPSQVLETRILPLYYTPLITSQYPAQQNKQYQPKLAT